MKICTVCQTENPDEAALCSACGTDITKKYIRRRRVRHKHTRSRSSGKQANPKGAKTVGILLLVALLATIILIMYFSVSH